MDHKKLLKKLGFTDYETKIYLTLVRLGPSKASVISRASSVPSNKVYESLIKLAQQGFVSSLDLTPKFYKVTGIEKLRELVEKQEKEIREIKSSLSNLERSISAKRPDIQDIATVLKGKKNIIAKLGEQTPKFEEYQYSFGGSLIWGAKSARLVTKAVRRGIDIRFLIHKDSKREEVYKKWRKVGVKIRFHPKAKQKSIRFSSIDNKIARVTVGKPQIEKEEDYLTFWIESPAFASMLKDQFLEMWEKANEK